MIARLGVALAALAAAVAILVGGLVAYRHYTDRYVVAVDDDGDAVARVVATTFHGASALKVASIDGIVQVPATDSRLFGFLNSDRVMKAPFSADYFVDVAHLRARDLRWDAATRTLTIDVPAIAVAPPNVDESRATVVRTRGLFVTRGAGDALQHAAAVRAVQVARAEADKPKWIAMARDRARTALAALLGAPLAAAGLHPATIRVRFPDERGRAPSGEQMDRSRSLDEVFGLGR